MNRKAAVVLGLFETGLGVARALGRQGIDVIGVDYKKDVGWYSRYVSPMRCPHPIKEENSFLEWLTVNFKEKDLLPIFLTADDFLFAISKNREYLSDLFLFNLPSAEQLNAISDKYTQYLMAKKAGVKAPTTWAVDTVAKMEAHESEFVHWPLFVKGRDVNAWRAFFGGTVKGFLARSPEELRRHIIPALEQKIPVVIQEVILGPDTNHFKYSAYVSKDGAFLAEFCLRKIRQQPVRFGIGSVVESLHYPELVAEGRKLFKGIGYRGVGSAEFKLDQRDGQLKLIELNPRYWQQNILTEACGINFALLNYRDLVEASTPEPVWEYQSGIKWVNIYMDFASFLQYRKEGLIDLKEWGRSLRGKKVFSDFAGDDWLPGLREIRFGWKLFKLPVYLWKKSRAR
jgi:predicted ATP-grasp superfamily ATP-dependent carboligase